jgi:Tol biopolymer transport system component
MKIEDLFDLKAVGRIALSPDATRVVFELKRADTKENKNFVQLMQVDVATGRVRPFTAAGKHSDTVPRWSADGSQLAFISTRDKTAALWIMPMDGGEARRITDR